MPHVRGESLEDQLRREAQVPLLDGLRIGREIAEGLAAIHARGLVHGKLTAGKIWLEPAGPGAPSPNPPHLSPPEPPPPPSENPPPQPPPPLKPPSPLSLS